MQSLREDVQTETQSGVPRDDPQRTAAVQVSILQQSVHAERPQRESRAGHSHGREALRMRGVQNGFPLGRHTLQPHSQVTRQACATAGVSAAATGSGGTAGGGAGGER